MEASLRSLIEAWDGLAVVSRYDAPTGSWIFICLHDGTLGPSTGGSRMKVYGSPAEGLLDAMRLAEGMTYKWAGIGLSYGGGKGVLAVPRQLEGEERRGLLRRYGRLIETLRGAFLTGEDLGTTTADMEVIAGETRFVHGRDPDNGSKVDPAPYTTRGVLAGIEAALGQAFGSPDPAGRTVLVQGVGNVGGRLAKQLAGRGARLLLSDLDAGRAARLAAEVGGEAVAGEAVYETPCDVYAPCAVGATVNQRTIPRLACRIVAGSANNQLEEPADAERLTARRILYVPDYIINAGGAMAFALIVDGVRPGAELLERIGTIGSTVAEILAEAEERGESPVATAGRRVEQRLEEGRRARTAADA